MEISLKNSMISITMKNWNASKEKTITGFNDSNNSLSLQLRDNKNAALKPRSIYLEKTI